MSSTIKQSAARVLAFAHPHGAARPGAPRILVVDDEPGIRYFLKEALGLVECEIAIAEDGASALALFEQRAPFDLLLSDLRMPGMNGVELGRRLQMQSPSLKVLYLTGYADALFEERPILWENESYLDKPCSVRALHEAVSMALYGRTDGLKTRQ